MGKKKVKKGDCPHCPFFCDMFAGYCNYYGFYPLNIDFGEPTCCCEKLS